MTVSTENFVRIDGRVTPRAERILRRAAAIANDRGYNYLGVEHLALAIAEEPEGVSASVWDQPLTMDGWHAAITEKLPPLPANTGEPLVITVARENPSEGVAD